MKFKHITNWHDMALGIPYETTWTESNYWKNKQVDTNQIQDTSNKFFDTMADLFTKFGVDIDVSGLSNEMQKTKYYAELLKEYIFEQVRLVEYPEKPSRMQCMFLFSNDIDHSDFANSLHYDMANKSIIEIEVFENSKLHFADLKLLDCNALTHVEKMDKARQYWKGTTEQGLGVEILFTGNFKINKVLQLPS